MDCPTLPRRTGSAVHEEASVHLQLPARPMSVRVAREAVRSLDALTGVEVVDRAALAVSELVTNAIRHGSSSEEDVIDVDLRAERGRVTGVVRDAGPAFALRQSVPDDRRTGGYGLPIVEKLGEVRVAHRDGGNAVTFTVGP